MPDNHFNWSRIYISDGRISTSMSRVIPRDLTLYSELDPAMWSSMRRRRGQTIFHEVELASFDKWHPQASRLLPLDSVKPEQVSENYFANVVFAALRESVHELWNTKKSHCIFTSSGYDSRLLAFIIMSLYKEFGDTWLGNTVFLECNGEPTGFLNAMEAIGWDRSRCFVYNEGAPVGDYHAASIDFESAWTRNEDLAGNPSAFSWVGLDWIMKQDIIPSDAQLFSGFFSNELAGAVMNGITMYDTFERLYYRHLPNKLLKTSVKTARPYQSLDVMEAVIKYSDGHLKPKGGIAYPVLKHCAPSALANLPNAEYPILTYHLSDTIMERAIADYRASWYGAKYPDIIPPPLICKNMAWAYWAVASYCEYLINSSYSILVEKG